mmetsp:Transcript_24425/g.55737  ORF Transcript_24425/g.55737 Transcript_24425/m.55737 type:complete len:205 (+) Transcript_24425:637-1251(+)
MSVEKVITSGRIRANFFSPFPSLSPIDDGATLLPTVPWPPTYFPNTSNAILRFPQRQHTSRKALSATTSGPGFIPPKAAVAPTRSAASPHARSSAVCGTGCPGVTYPLFSKRCTISAARRSTNGPFPSPDVMVGRSRVVATTSKEEVAILGRAPTSSMCRRRARAESARAEGEISRGWEAISPLRNALYVTTLAGCPPFFSSIF